MIRLKLSALILTLSLVFVLKARAIDITVINTDPSGPGSLTEAINQANMTAVADNILFQAGLSGTITPNSTLNITQPVTIDGNTDADTSTNEITVSGGNLRTVFFVDDVAAEFRNFRIINGLGNLAAGFNGGGAIVMNGSASKPLLTVRRMAFEGNRADLGGAIITLSADVEIFDSFFSNNQATAQAGAGGAVYVFDEINTGTTYDIIRCTFFSNSTTTPPTSSAGSGGGGAIVMFSDGGTLNVEACYFNGNTTVGGDGGGAIQAGAHPAGSGGARSASLIVTDSLFFGNRIVPSSATVIEGGAILVDGGDTNNTMTTTISGSTFLNNTAVSSGGGVMLSGAGSTSGGNFFNTATIQNSTFEGNSAELGGAIYSNNTRLAVDSCTITNNTATGTENDSMGNPMPTAGGISLVSSNMLGTFTIRNTILDGNSGQQMRAYNGFQNGSNTSLGNNLINGTILDVAGFSTLASDRTGAANLAALAANGKTVGSPGNTAVIQTRPPNAGSQVLNNGNTDLTTDQNGNSRPDGPQDDIGAIEGVATTPPTANCQSITAQLDATGNVTVNATQIDNNSTPGGTTTITAVEIAKGDQTAMCATASFSSSVAYNCSDVGAKTVTLRITQSDGETACCTATVTVQDNIAPTAACQDTTVQLDASGNASITGADVDNGSNDACGLASLNVSPNSFTCANVGNNTVTLTVTDNNGNTSTCTATVTVEDNVAPTAVCQDMTVQLDASGNASITGADVDNGSNDACGLASLNVSPNSFTCANVGGNMVTLTATDNNGNASTCMATVTVEDNVAPTAVCQGITVPLDATGNASITANDVDNGSNDACGLAMLSVSPNSFTCANVGGNMVTLTATDNNGNTSTCMANVTITNQNPVISGNMSLSVNKNSTCPAASNELTLTATDDGDVALLQWSIDTAPATGTVTIDGGTTSTGGSVTICYQPNADQIAADSFTILVGDQCSGMATHTVNVTVDNQIPVITGDTTLTVDKNSTCPAASNELTLSATDDANVALLQWSIQTAPATGTVTIDGGATSTGGTVTICYEPTADQGAADSFVILVDDQCGGMQIHTVNVTVRNQAPGILADTTLTVAKNSTCPAASNELVLNATDDASLALLQWSIQTAPATGTVTIDGGTTSSGGTVTICYQPNTDQGAADRFTILVDDQCGGTATHTVDVTVDNANPVINGNTTLTVAKGSACPNAANELTLTATDDASLALLQWSIDTAPATGTVTIDGGTMSTGGMVTVCYEPNPNQGAADSFTILVDDQCGGTATHMVNVTVTNQTPIITQGDGPLNLTVDAGSTCPNLSNQVALDADDPDADNAIMTWSVTGAPMSGTVTFDGGIDAGPNVTVCYQPNANQNEVDSFTVTVDDNCGGTDEIQVIVTVRDIVDPTITCPPDVIVILGQSTDPFPVGTATATDDLDPNPAITFDDVVATSDCPQAQTITRTWTATDAGGNMTTCTQTIVVNDADSDGDGEPDCSDGCPNDANKIAPGDCGCGQADVDEDGNGVSDCLDEPIGQEPPAEQDLPLCVPFLFQSLFGIPLCGPCLLHGLLMTLLSLVGMRRWNRRRLARRNRGG